MCIGTQPAIHVSFPRVARYTFLVTYSSFHRPVRARSPVVPEVEVNCKNPNE